MSLGPDERVGAPDRACLDRPPVPDLTVDGAVQPFWLRAAPVRGRLVRLGPLADAILSRHGDNPPAVNAILGEALALTAGLAAALKFEGSFSFQARGDGALPMLLADCTDAGALRGYARFDADKLAAIDAEAPSAARLLGAGYLAFTVDRGPDSESYQGIVPLEGASLAEITHAYFRTSEQTETAVAAHARPGPHGWRAGALIIERVAMTGGVAPPPPEVAEDAWRAAVAFVATLSTEELLDDALPPQMLLRRLFFELAPAFGEPRALSYGCRCTRARLSRILEGFSDDDLDHMAESDAGNEADAGKPGGRITMNCEFCNHAFTFDRRDFGA